MPDMAKIKGSGGIESAYAWMRLAAAVLLMGLGGCGMYSVTVVLPLIQAEFGVSRADASLPYTATMIGFTIGGILMGRFSDRVGVIRPALLGPLGLARGPGAARWRWRPSQFRRTRSPRRAWGWLRWRLIEAKASGSNSLNASVGISVIISYMPIRSASGA